MKSKRAPQIVIALLILSAASNASAFCRTTTCRLEADCTDDPTHCCVLNSDGCDTNGIPLAWPTACVGYSTQEDGSPLRDISASQLETAVVKAFATWSAADCGNVPPSITTENLGTVTCGLPTYNSDSGNANVWLFRDDAWPHTPASTAASSSVYSSALALTTVSYNYKTGEIYDADVELNSFESGFSVGDNAVSIDLLSIVTHEAGHFLGLDHSLEANSSMLAGYFPGSISPRDLGQDDVNGLCTIYPDARKTTADSCEPRHGFSSSCESSGCAMHRGPRESAPFALYGGLGLLLALGVRRIRAAKA